MSNDIPHPDTFNARWVSFEKVAETFVPIPQFSQLLHNSNSLLLGPRGCGKTTLLKMLTRRAQDTWLASERATGFALKFDRVIYEAVYVPSDVRWSYEVRGIPSAVRSNETLVMKAQRIVVGLNVIFHVLGNLRDLVSDQREIERAICEQLIRRMRLLDTVPSIRDVRCAIELITASIRGGVSSGNSSSLETLLDKQADFLFGHALDPAISVIQIISEYLPKDVSPPQWAICYDELEIAPEWLREELIAALRSTSQNVLLKLTWFPILPTGVPTSPGATDDFRPIRLWHSHVENPKGFCEGLAKQFLERRYGKNAPSPSEFFSRSVLASEAADEPTKAYERGSTEYQSFKELAEWDSAFRTVLIERKIDPDDPVPRNQEEKDQFFRKVKPIVLLRNEFSDINKGRSRKAPALYVGREAIYAMSEGNPRWLLGLLSDLIDLGEQTPVDGNAKANISYASQGRLLTNASNRLRTLIKSSPFNPPENIVGTSEHTLIAFIEALGDYFNKAIHSRETFREDPVGSFEFPKDSDALYSSIVTQLLEIGALVYVGSTAQEVPCSVTGARFRLSFMLAPLFRLPFRNLKAISMREILGRETDKAQLQLPI